MTEEEAKQLSLDLRDAPYPYHQSPLEARLTVEASMAHRYADAELAAVTWAAMGSTASDNGVIEAVAGEALIFDERYAQVSICCSLGSAGPRPPEECSQPTWHSDSLGSPTACMDRASYRSRARGRAGHRCAQAIGLTELPAYAIGALPAGWVAWERGDLTAAETLIDAVSPAIRGIRRGPRHRTGAHAPGPRALLQG